MGYVDNYEACIKRAAGFPDWCAETGKRMAIGYTSNLDIIVEWDEANFNRLLKECLDGPSAFTEGEVINTIHDLARVVSYFAVNGLGGEVEVTNVAVVDEIKQRFSFRCGLGGTCAQGAAALAAIGIPALVHITDASKEVVEWLPYKEIEVVKDNKAVPIIGKWTDAPPLIHLIMQYTKGGKITMGEVNRKIPLSNRLIIDLDNVHKDLPVDKGFMVYLEEHAKDICSYDISGFNAILDQTVLETRLAELCAHYNLMKRLNPALIIYLESAHYASSSIRDRVYEILANHIDILGMNEEELVDFSDKSGIAMNKDDIRLVIGSLEEMLEIFPVKGIVLHTKDYSLYCGVELQDADIELGLTMGNIMSGTRARTGRYGTPDDCLETLDLKLSETGVMFHDQLKQMELKYHTVLVPSRYMERPKYTIGLGDTFVAGMQLGFMK